jgi:Fumarylacetoacetate (FAA) hydrolase family
MLFNVYKLLNVLSQGTTLAAGTLVMTGTPMGVVMFAFHPIKFLKSGEIVECEIESIGTLRNMFVGHGQSTTSPCPARVAGMFTGRNCISMHDPHLCIEWCNMMLNEQGPASSCAATHANPRIARACTSIPFAWNSLIYSLRRFWSRNSESLLICLSRHVRVCTIQSPEKTILLSSYPDSINGCARVAFCNAGVCDS